MAKRKGWDAISAAQRRRYERSGITRESYNAGADLKKARGHENEFIPKQRKPARRGDTLYFDVRGYSEGEKGRLLSYLIRKRYQAIRYIYGREGEKQASTEWMLSRRESQGRLSERMLFESFQYSESDPVYQPADLTYIAASPPVKR